VLSEHYVVASKKHQPQLIEPMYADMLFMAKRWKGMAVFYNGAKCGASAPDHAHIQAVRTSDVPLFARMWKRKIDTAARLISGNIDGGIYYSDAYVAPLFIVKARDEACAEHYFKILISHLPVSEGGGEPMVNVFTVYSAAEGWTTIVFPRLKHRPDCYFSEGDELRLVSPGALDMAGVLILARKEDYDSITADEAYDIIKEVALPADAAVAIAEKISSCQ
jgi:ATP adenylyltransferase/5',5'''-P-1,P-4-tetraphosphate phosphorylase II